MILGLLLALASALATNVAFLFKHRGAVLAPPILVRHPLRSAVGLFRSRWLAIGWMVAILAWGLHVGALSLAPLSIVQAVLSGGLVFLAVFAVRYFGFHLGRRQWVGVTITAAGLVVIALTGGGATHPQHASLAALIAVEGAIFATGAALVRISTRRHLPDRAEGLLLGAAAGALFGVSDVAIKWLTQAAPGPLLGALSPWTLTALVAGVISFYASARSLQIGRASRSSRSPRWPPPGRDHRPRPGLPRADRLGCGSYHRALSRVLPRDRRRSAHARPDARHPRRGLTRQAARAWSLVRAGQHEERDRRVLQRGRSDHQDVEDLVVAEDGGDGVGALADIDDRAGGVEHAAGAVPSVASILGAAAARPIPAARTAVRPAAPARRSTPA
jgi:drug/metabolite transporter (DMT)-like permease